MDTLNAHTKHRRTRFHNIIYSNVHIIILCSLNDRLKCIVLFEVISIIFQAFQNHHGEQCESKVSLKEIMHYLLVLKYWTNFLIGPIPITVKINIYSPIRYGGQYIVHSYLKSLSYSKRDSPPLHESLPLRLFQTTYLLYPEFSPHDREIVFILL